MADDRVCQGYHVIRRKRIWDAEVVLAHNPSEEYGFLPKSRKPSRHDDRER